MNVRRLFTVVIGAGCVVFVVLNISQMSFLGHHGNIHYNEVEVITKPTTISPDSKLKTSDFWDWYSKNVTNATNGITSVNQTCPYPSPFLGKWNIRADSRFAPSQWETALHCTGEFPPYKGPLMQSLMFSPLQRVSNRTRWYFLCCYPENICEETVELPAMTNGQTLMRHHWNIRISLLWSICIIYWCV